MTMGKHFETHHDATIDATPDQIWDAIATGPGISTWFVGRTEIHDDTVRTAFGDNWIRTGTIKIQDRPHRFAYASEPAPTDASSPTNTPARKPSPPTPKP